MKLSRKQKLQRIGTVVLLFVFIGVGVFGYMKYGEFQDKARAMESIALLKTLHKWADASLTEEKTYPASFAELGFAPGGELHSHIFLSSEKVPPAYLRILSTKMIPFLAKDDFRFLTILHTNDTIFFHSIDRARKIRAQRVRVDEADMKAYDLPRSYTFDPQRAFN